MFANATTQLKSHSTEKQEVIGPKAIWIWSVKIFAVFYLRYSAVPLFRCSTVLFYIAHFFFYLYQNHMDFWPQTSSFSFELDFWVSFEIEDWVQNVQNGFLIFKRCFAEALTVYKSRIKLYMSTWFALSKISFRLIAKEVFLRLFS